MKFVPQLGCRQAEVLEYLSEHGELETAELEEMMGCRVRKTLQRLRKRGIVESRQSRTHPNGKVHTLAEGYE